MPRRVHQNGSYSNPLAAQVNLSIRQSHESGCLQLASVWAGRAVGGSADRHLLKKGDFFAKSGLESQGDWLILARFVKTQPPQDQVPKAAMNRTPASMMLLSRCSLLGAGGQARIHENRVSRSVKASKAPQGAKSA
jgi:hypothetical protein